MYRLKGKNKMTNNSQELPTRFCDYPDCMEPAPYGIGDGRYCAEHFDAGMKDIVGGIVHDIVVQEQKPVPKRLRKKRKA